jgi:tRNA (cmo5U34)-methyltransferase
MSTATQPQHDETIPAGKWAFDGDVTRVFEDMLARSIPQYDEMRRLSSLLAVRFAQRDTWIIDLGCSRGDALIPILDRCGAYNRYLGIEISEPMIAAARERLSGYIQSGMVEIRSLDLREKVPTLKSSVTLSVLTLQFIPIEYRQKIVQSVYDALLPGGAFIFVEKILGANAHIDDVMVETYLDMKRDHGYTEDQIQRKRLSLEGVLVPITAQWNEAMLHNAGFLEVDCFWRWMNFAGWIAIKK